jgi:hypothetical protein
MLDTTTGGRVTSTEFYDFHLRGGAVQHSAAHARGTREHLHLYSGRIRVGPTSEPVEIAAGDFVSFYADREHMYQGIGAGQVSGLLVITRTEP